jgi:hypothetical protein
MSRIVTTIVLWVAVVSLLANGALVAVILHREAEEKQPGGDPDKPGNSQARPDKLTEPDQKFGADLAATYGVSTEPARGCSWQQRVVVYGRVVPNPRATYEVRSPFAGTFLAAETPWPQIGQTVKPGQVLGRVAVRVSPQERLELQNKLAEAVLKEKGAREIYDLRQGVVARLEKAPSAVIVQRDLDEAKVQLAEAKTQLATAEAAVQIWRNTLDDIERMQDKPAEMWQRALAVPSEANLGALEVTELAGQPGTAIEAGGMLARLVDTSRVLVRLDLPSDVAGKEPPAELELSTQRRSNTNSESAPATLVGPAAMVDGNSQLTGFYYLVRNRSWRPGYFVIAELPAPNASPQDAISVPASAVLYHQGYKLVYIKGKTKFERRVVDVLGFENDRCILAAKPFLHAPNYGIDADDLVVSSNPQVLLSSDFRRDVDDD